jgi:crotonobetainyl-CoA:carnitine CoA-transferase CaiB-like acyl-CoA transferase
MGDAANSRRALDGVRILDLSQVAIGPYATFLLVSLGAQVIKVESHRRADTSRGPVQPLTESQRNQYPGREPGERPWNRTAYFNQRNRGKLGITLDFSTAAGKRLLKNLAAVSDAVVENFRASVLDRQGLGWEALREVNPRLVYLKLSSQGATGPERDYGSLGSTLEQTGGIASITGYRDGVPLLTNETYPDPVAGILGAGALIAGLRRAHRTGRGQFVDLSQREVTAAVLGEAMIDYALNGRVAAPIGNRHPSMAPHGVYPCRDERPPPKEGHPPGRWIAIAVADDEQWRGLCRAMGDPTWCADPRFATVAGRWRHQDEIDNHLAAWTAGWDHIELTHLLQRHGVPAGAVLDGVELLADEHLAARGWWDHVTPTDIGRPFPMIAPPWRMSGSPYHPLPPAPRLGEHNDEIIRDLLGVDEERYAAYQAEGVISTEAQW